MKKADILYIYNCGLSCVQAIQWRYNNGVLSTVGHSAHTV